ncbi:MAG: AAA family ATPase, partial [Acidimicrobiales bacterium]
PDGTAIAAVPDETRYSTHDLLALEQWAVHHALARATADVALVDARSGERVLADRPSMSDEQAEMFRRLTSSGAGVEVVVGKAGAGKTYALDAARAAWQASGHRVTGAALAARAAVELETGAGIDSYTIDRLLADVEHPEHGGLAPESVLVVDEAGMVGTRKLARLLDAAAAADAKVVLVGDPHQLPEIDAGGVLRGLANRLEAIELTDNRRQIHGWERDALDQLRDGDPTAGLAAYTDAGRIHIGETVDAAREQLVGDWWHARTEDGIDGVMVALRRSDVDDLNTRARTRAAATGELTGPELVAGGRTFQVGDRIVCLRNDRRLDVVNGTRGDVVAIDNDTRTLTVQPDNSDRLVKIPAAYLDAGHVDHAYAITGHKAQGLTTQATWVLGSDAMYREWGYVALSRGSHTNHLYVVAGHDLDAAAHQPVLEAADPVRRLVADLRRSRAQHLAIDHTDERLVALTDDQLRDHLDRLRHRLLDAAGDGQQRQADRLRSRQEEFADKVRTLSNQLTDVEADKPRRRRQDAMQQHAARLMTLLDLHERQLADVTSLLADAPSDRDQTPVHAAAHAFEEADLELQRRATRRGARAVHAPTTAVVEPLGPRPDTPAARRRWTDAVTAIEHYRGTWGIDDDSVLGPPPDDLTQRRHRDAVQALLPDPQDRTPQRSDLTSASREPHSRELA